MLPSPTTIWSHIRYRVSSKIDGPDRGANRRTGAVWRRVLARLRTARTGGSGTRTGLGELSWAWLGLYRPCRRSLCLWACSASHWAIPLRGRRCWEHRHRLSASCTTALVSPSWARARMLMARPLAAHRSCTSAPTWCTGRAWAPGDADFDARYLRLVRPGVLHQRFDGLGEHLGPGNTRGRHLRHHRRG